MSIDFPQPSSHGCAKVFALYLDLLRPTHPGIVDGELADLRHHAIPLVPAEVQLGQSIAAGQRFVRKIPWTVDGNQLGS